jgi:WhiB family transcriptional regulator, redox-sensing transcriptional regulator
MTGIMKAGAILGTSRVSVIQGEELDWQLEAACRGRDSRLFFPNTPNVEQKALKAKRICHTCPVLVQCRKWALEQREAWGVWGGMSEEDRKAFWENRPIRHRRHHRKMVEWFGDDDDW